MILKNFKHNTCIKEALDVHTWSHIAKLIARLFRQEKVLEMLFATRLNSGSGKVAVEYWTCSLEPHQQGGEHYHVCVKLTGPKRWFSVKKFLMTNHNVTVHFSDNHDNYYSAYKYVTKSDSNFHCSDNHPNLQEIGSPQTKNSTKAYRRKHKSSSLNETDTKKTKLKRLTNFEVSQFIVLENTKTDTELFAKAQQQKEAGKFELANFLLSRSPKALSDLMENTWKMQGAITKVNQNNTPRLECIRTCASQECVEGCDGKWFRCASEVLEQNKIHTIVFAQALRELLVKGRGKFRNLMITGPTNCGKTFLFRPLEHIFDTFSNPSNDKYAWLGAEKAQIIFLNDFRWSSEMIAWKELLLLLEGQAVHLPAPKNHYAKDICVSSDTPIVATGKSRIMFQGRGGQSDPMENEMIDVRWRFFELFKQIPAEQQLEISPCPKCFAKLTLTGEL